MGRLLPALLYGLLLSGCTMEVSVSNLPVAAPSVKLQSSVTSFAVVSKQHDTTVENGYKVQHSMGSLTDQIVTETPENGYKVYVSTQGVLIQ